LKKLQKNCGVSNLPAEDCINLSLSKVNIRLSLFDGECVGRERIIQSVGNMRNLHIIIIVYGTLIHILETAEPMILDRMPPETSCSYNFDR
jgi:hypothetical protein